MNRLLLGSLSLSLSIVASSAFVLAAAPLAPASAAEAPTCQGQPATLVVTGGRASATPGDDVIVASGYRTVVEAGAGDDLVCLVSGSPTVEAGRGDDVVDATAIAADDYPHADLGPGSDTYQGGEAHDYVTTGSGPGEDVVSTGNGRDDVTVTSPRAVVSLGDDHDRLTLTPGVLRGGRLDLGADRDVVEVRARDRAVTVDLPAHRLVVGRAHYRLLGAENAAVTARRARIVGDAEPQVLNTTACAATIIGGAGPDRLTAVATGPHRTPPACPRPHARLLGGPGADRLTAYRLRATLIGGPGEDHATGGAPGTRCRAEHCRG